MKRTLHLAGSRARCDQIGDTVQRCQTIQTGRQILKQKSGIATARLAPPFEQQAQRGRIDFGHRGQIDYQITATELLLATLAQRDNAGDGDRALQAQLVTVPGYHFFGACCWDNDLFLFESDVMSPSMPLF